MESIHSKAEQLNRDVLSLKDYLIPENIQPLVEFVPKEELKFQCLLDELMFYQVRIGFPQLLINFLLKLLPNDEFKVSYF
jgi:hypothetical protein